MRRIEALTGPEGVKLLRGYDDELSRAATTLRVPPNQVADAVAELARACVNWSASRNQAQTTARVRSISMRWRGAPPTSTGCRC